MRTDILKLGLGLAFSVLMLSTVAFAQGLQDVIQIAKDVGVFQFYLPFLLSFAVLYALLLKTGVFGAQKNLVTIIALAASGFIMVYTPVGIAFSTFLANFVGNAIVVILTIIVVLIFVGMLQSGKILPENFNDIMKGNTLWLFLLLLVLIVLGVFVASGGTSIFPGLNISTKQLFGSIGGLSPTTLAIILLVVGTGIIVWLFSKPDKAPAK
ncbi:MAG: hypothetical protein HYS62_01120 [Candidatus Aenigmarchaeota archaeon]|nr:hypothetical protein [Candidatus Aenigmarchaeota archaeon]